MDYSEQLKHPKWQKKRLEIMKRDKFTCRICGDKETTLNVHHIEYYQNYLAWEYPNNRLLTLCCHCHHEVEKANKNKLTHPLDFKIHKSKGYENGDRIMFEFNETEGFSLSIYNKNDCFINGYTIGFDIKELKSINKIIKETIKKASNG